MDVEVPTYLRGLVIDEINGENVAAISHEELFKHKVTLRACWMWTEYMCGSLRASCVM